MKKTARTRLTLHRETLRNLDSERLTWILGGGVTEGPGCYSIGCPVTTAGCPPGGSNNCETGSAGCHEN